MHAGEFWIGLDFVHQVTQSEPHLLQIDLLDIDDNYVSMVYDGFLIGGKDDGYRFYVSISSKFLKGIRKDLLLSSNPHWNITELASIVLRHNRTKFITSDHINPSQTSSLTSKQQLFYRECSTWFRSGWWYVSPTRSSIYDKAPLLDSCRHLNLFQLMAPLESSHDHLSVKWNNWYHDDGDGDGHTPRQLRYIMMKIRPDNR
ncbi:fibroleukin-like protein [Euroglyphus maynei]|uniref:Fibroleukin-like protein n=1 Tax=Euroglyphus maynei TaxID=6958 RepID=A0A1Y3B1A2_EURMA|nr:fibroleukin-like protein [Euroglyphus maynei]